MSARIVLAAVNARYTHSSLGLRSLRANLGLARERSRLAEFDLNADPGAVARDLLEGDPDVIALGVYIWNAERVREIVRDVRRRSARTRIVLGGPELDAESAGAWRNEADRLLPGEAEDALSRLCAEPARLRRAGDVSEPGPPPDLARLVLPDAEYSAHDLATRTTYVETSRGCPFRCAYCLSARDNGVRFFPEEAVFASLDRLLRRGAHRLKFVDRSFNADPVRAARLLDFWLERARPGLRVQFEAVPERFPDPLRDRLRRFPPGMLRLEVGVQTLDPGVSEQVDRHLDPARVEEAFLFLRDETRVTVHADLVAGLPGETLAGFGRGFDRLVSWQPAELQVGLLKRLRGTPLAARSEPLGMRFESRPPYALIDHPCWTEEDTVRIRRFARFWDRCWNRGRLRAETAALWAGGGSPFEAFLAFSEQAFERFGRDWGLPLEALRDALTCGRPGVQPRACADPAAAIEFPQFEEERT